MLPFIVMEWNCCFFCMKLFDGININCIKNKKQKNTKGKGSGFHFSGGGEVVELGD